MVTCKTASSSLAEMLRGYSIEINPSNTKIVDAIPERLDTGSEVFLTWIPGADPMDMVAPSQKLRHNGFFPVPHIGARHIEDQAQLEQLAERLAGDAGVDRVLIVAGDRDKPAGPYDSSLEVLRSGVLQKVGIVRVAVGGFPEGNPNIPAEILNKALSAKVNFARSTGLQLSIVTQFCFASEPIIEWIHFIRNLAIDVPVRIGLAGPAGPLTLMRYAVRCGIGNSVRLLTEKSSFAKLLIEKGPEPILRGIATSAAHQGADAFALGIEGFHFYTFGGFSKTVDWISGERAEQIQ